MSTGIERPNRVIVVGAGGAACRAAVAAADAGAEVTMLIKGGLGSSGATAYGVAEIAAFNVADGLVDPTDDSEAFYNDIVRAGQGVADPAVVRVLVENAPKALEDLESWGVPFERKGKHYLEIQACFSTKPRSHIIRGHGEPILRALIAQIRKRGIAVLENSTAVRLIVHNGRCEGVVYLDAQSELRTLSADATILAAGGAGRLFRRNLNPPDVTGDGYTLGWEAGAALVNMEFMQAGIGLSSPIENIMNSWIWASRPVIRNADEEVFLPKYLPAGIEAAEVFDAHRTHFPFSSSDISRYIEIAVQSEIVAGRGTPEGGIYLDLRHITDDFLAKLPEGNGLKTMWPMTYEYVRQRGVDLRREPVQIACFAHAVNGGLKIDAQGQTTLPGLYSAGENAGGPHGADRLGGNMMVTCQVFGEIAGRNAARQRSAVSEQAFEIVASRTIEAATESISRDVGRTGLYTRLADTAQDQLLVIRNREGLESLIGEIDALETEAVSRPRINPNRSAWELHSLMTTARIMTEACLARRESRGSHYRSDYPRTDPELSAAKVVEFPDGAFQGDIV